MATQSVARRWTYERYARLPDDGNRYEVIGGELYMTPAPRPIHQRAVTRLAVVLEQFVQQHQLGWVLTGPVDILFAEGDYLEPDLVFVRRERAGIITDRGIEGPPDLVVEVVSDATADRDPGVKRERYAWFGVLDYWILDLKARHVEVYRMTVDPTKPRVEREVVQWQPGFVGPVLEISVQDILRGFE